MPTAYTSLLGLALPVTGELSGTWGDTVNNSITSLLDTSVAGTTNVSTDADVTLTTTTGASNTARQAILLFSGARTALRTVTAPAQSKIYTVINATTGGFSVKLVGAGPTTGVTIVAGESAVCAWNGSDFVKVSNTGGSASFVNLTASGTVTFTGLTASQAVFTNASDELVSNAITGTGSVVMSASPTLTGTIGAAAATLSGNLTLSGGTANGVAYLNGSKVVTSGSALTFDGSRLLVGTTTAGVVSGGIRAVHDATEGSPTGVGDEVGWVQRNFNSSQSCALAIVSGTASTSSLYFGDKDSINVGSVVYSNSDNSMRFNASGSEQMRLNSTGLGIGTSSPAAKLDVSQSQNGQTAVQLTNSNAGASTEATFIANNGTYIGSFGVAGASKSAFGAILASDAYIFSNANVANTGITLMANSANGVIKFATGGSTEKMRLDTSGNLGLGVTPSAWATYTTLQINNGSVSNYSPTQDMRISSNAYYNSGWKYIASAPACQYLLDGSNGGHQWFTAPSGTAGNAITFTQAMTLTASGNLGIGNTSPDSKLVVEGGSGTYVQVKDGTVNTFIQARSADSSGVVGTITNHALAFYTNSTEKARIDSSGNFIVGGTSYQAGGAFSVATTGTFTAVLDSGTGGDYLMGAINGVSNGYQIVVTTGNAQTYKWHNGGDQSMTLDASGNLMVGTTTPSANSKLTLSGAGITIAGGRGSTYALNWADWSVYNSSSGNALVFDNGSERARIDSSGKFLIGTTTNNFASRLVVFNDNSYTIESQRTTTASEGHMAFANANGAVGSIFTNGTATSFNTSSDYRLKNTITPMTGALAKVALLKPVTYKWNADGSDGQGFIAHELAEVCPQAVTGEKDAVDAKGNPQYQGIDVSFLVATLTAAIKEQQAIIESLKARLDAANL